MGIAAPVLQALSFMHELSLMHRDVKVMTLCAALLATAQMTNGISEKSGLTAVGWDAGSQCPSEPGRAGVSGGLRCCGTCAACVRCWSVRIVA